MECLRALLACRCITDCAYDSMPERERREIFEEARAGVTAEVAKAMRLSATAALEEVTTMAQLVESYLGHPVPPPTVWEFPSSSADVSHTPALDQASIGRSGRLMVGGTDVFGRLSEAVRGYETLETVYLDTQAELRRRSLLSRCLQACYTCGTLEADPLEAAGEDHKDVIRVLGGPERARCVAQYGVPCPACFGPRGHTDPKLKYCEECARRMISVHVRDGTAVLKGGRFRGGQADELSEQTFLHRLKRSDFEEYCQLREVQAEERARHGNPSSAALTALDQVSVDFCPGGCGQRVDGGWDACAAITCPRCGTHFCGLCLHVSDTSYLCHRHVEQCDVNPVRGNLFVKNPEEIVRRRVQSRVAEFASWHCTQLRKRADEILDHDFRRPEQGTQTAPLPEIPCRALFGAARCSCVRALSEAFVRLRLMPPPKRRKRWGCISKRYS